MSSTPTTHAVGELTLAEIRVGPPDVVDETWKDEFVNRLFRELKRQLAQLENTKPTTEIDQARIRAENTRTLASIERTLERLLRIEQHRALLRETKVAQDDDDARAALERRLDERLAAIRALPPLAEPEQ